MLHSEFMYWDNQMMSDSDFLHWLRDRLINVHGENNLSDHMIRLYKLARKLEDDDSYWNEITKNKYRETD